MLKRTVRRVSALTAAAVLGLGALTGGIAAAAPQTAQATCPYTRTLCLWDGTNFTGTLFTVQSSSPTTGACINLAAHGWGNGRAESALSTSNQLARLYTGTNCTGSSYQLIPFGTYSPITFNSNSVFLY